MQNSHLAPASLDEAARFLAVSSRTVRRLIDAGALPCLRIGSALAVPVTSLPGMCFEADAGPDMRPLLTRHDVAARLGCAPLEILNLTKAGQLRSVFVGRSERWVPADIDALEAEHADDT